MKQDGRNTSTTKMLTPNECSHFGDRNVCHTLMSHTHSKFKILNAHAPFLHDPHPRTRILIFFFNFLTPIFAKNRRERLKNLGSGHVISMGDSLDSETMGTHGLMEAVEGCAPDVQFSIYIILCCTVFEVELSHRPHTIKRPHTHTQVRNTKSQ